MRRCGVWWVVACAVVLAAGCGKKGNPLPPLRPVPVRIGDIAATRTANQVALRFTVPAANIDGTTPAAVDRVEVYALGVAAGAAPPVAGVVADVRNLRSRVVVRRPTAETAPPAAGSDPAPGEQALYVDRLDGLGDPPPATLYFVAVPVAGSGRGRRGPLSPVLAVPLGPRPTPPEGVTLTHDETTVRVAWQPTAPELVYRAVLTSAAGEEVTGVAPLTPAPIAQPEVTFPVVFGQEVCLVVRTVAVFGAVSVEGDSSRPACLTPVDRYAPPVPGGLQAVQEGAAVTLIWNAVEVSDLAGYVVLRGAAGGDDLQPLMRSPIRETTFRDTTVQPGTGYTYAVYAVDSASVPNISQLSVRQTVTVR